MALKGSPGECVHNDVIRLALTFVSFRCIERSRLQIGEGTHIIVDELRL